MNTELYDIAPNGMKVDMVRLEKVPNVDHSDYEYRISHRWYDGEEYEVVGQVSLIDGTVHFSGGQLSLPALRLLHDWLKENVEPTPDYIAPQ